MLPGNPEGTGGLQPGVESSATSYASGTLAESFELKKASVVRGRNCFSLFFSEPECFPGSGWHRLERAGRNPPWGAAWHLCSVMDCRDAAVLGMKGKEGEGCGLLTLTPLPRTTAASLGAPDSGGEMPCGAVVV